MKKSYHSIFTILPLTLLTLSLVLDLLYVITGNTRITEVAFYMIALGIISGFMTAVFGLIDWMEIPGGTRAKRVGMWHGIGNGTVLTLFITSWFLRAGIPDAPSTNSLAVAFSALLLAFLMAKIGTDLTIAKPEVI